MLQSLWHRFNPFSRQRESVSLNPVEQLTLRFLLGVGEATRGSIETEVTSTRRADSPEVDQALGLLTSKELVSARPGDDGQSYLPTPKAAKLRGNIPVEPRTVTEFYL